MCDEVKENYDFLFSENEGLNVRIDPKLRQMRRIRKFLLLIFFSVASSRWLLLHKTLSYHFYFFTHIEILPVFLIKSKMLENILSPVFRSRDLIHLEIFFYFWIFLKANFITKKRAITFYYNSSGSLSMFI